MSIKFGKPIEEINEMDPVRKLWYYQNWLADKYDQNESIKDLGLLIGSFIDVERVKDILNLNGNKRISTDEEFDESTKMVREIDRIDLPHLNNRSRPKGIYG